MERSLRFQALRKNVQDACNFVVRSAQNAGLDSGAVYHCEIAVDEICTNIVEHGYSGAALPGEIIITTWLEENCFKITISDSSSPFDPTAYAEPDIQSEVFKREPGGWGIYFVRRIMDAVQYEYREGKNHLVLTKCLTRTALPIEPDSIAIVTAPLEQGYWLLTPNGRLDNLGALVLAAKFEAEAQQEHYRLILDLKQVDYISSSGLKVLASAWRQAHDHQGRLLLTGLSPRVSEIMDMVGFTTFFQIFPDVRHALAEA